MANPDDPIACRREAGCWTLTLRRSAKANALTAAMMTRLAEVADEAGREPEPPLLLLASDSPRAFCAGADIAEFADDADALQRQEHALRALITAFTQGAAPVLALARGRASGAGAILLALADGVIAADDLVVAAPEIAFGMYPVIVEAVLASRLSPALAQQLCLSGRAVDAAEALSLGLITEALPAAGFEPAAAARVRHYRERLVALRTLRQARRGGEPARQLLLQLPRVAPLMARNHADAGVRARIEAYRAALGRRAG